MNEGQVALLESSLMAKNVIKCVACPHNPGRQISVLGNGQAASFILVDCEALGQCQQGDRSKCPNLHLFGRGCPFMLEHRVFGL